MSILWVIMDGNIEKTWMKFPDLRLSWRGRLVVLLVVGLFLYACTGHHVRTVQSKGVYHRVKSGDTLWNIARAYKVNVQDLAEINNITDPNMIELDRVIFIPSVNYIVDDVMLAAASAKPARADIQRGENTSQVAFQKKEPKDGKGTLKPERPTLKDSFTDQQGISSKTTTPASEREAEVAGSKNGSQKAVRIKTTEVMPGENGGKLLIKENSEQKTGKISPSNGRGQSEKIKFDRERFTWPVKGKVTSQFGIQPNGMYYNGIRISSAGGTPVNAAAVGIVVFSAHLKDYGETIIIKHEENYATVYTNLGSRMVKVDDRVIKGSQIALMGQHDRWSESYMNFEIRHKNKARNPLFYLP